MEKRDPVLQLEAAPLEGTHADLVLHELKTAEQEVLTADQITVGEPMFRPLLVPIEATVPLPVVRDGDSHARPLWQGALVKALPRVAPSGELLRMFTRHARENADDASHLRSQINNLRAFIAHGPGCITEVRMDREASDNRVIGDLHRDWDLWTAQVEVERRGLAMRWDALLEGLGSVRAKATRLGRNLYHGISSAADILAEITSFCGA